MWKDYRSKKSVHLYLFNLLISITYSNILIFQIAAIKWEFFTDWIITQFLKMPATQFTSGTTSNGLTNRHVHWNTLTSKRLQLPSQSQQIDQRSLLCSKNGGWYSPINYGKLSTSFSTRCRKPYLTVVRNQIRPDCDVDSPDLDECLASLTSENDIISKEEPSQYDANGNLP